MGWGGGIAIIVAIMAIKGVHYHHRNYLCVQNPQTQSFVCPKTKNWIKT
jgi:hypothetical protein